MLAIFKKEIASFFSSPMAYLVLGIFLICTGLFLWVFHGSFNIFDNGFADLSNFFLLAPWIFLVLVPAITMKSFSEERRTGTIEMLFTKPVSILKIVIGKYLAIITLIILSILPTLVYLYSISSLDGPSGGVDLGLAFGSYFGLLFLVFNYAAIGVFTSSVTDNQIVAFITALILSFIVFYGFDALATILDDGSAVLFVQGLGMKSRVETLARGILDTSDMIYFLSFSVFFLFLTVMQLKNMRR
jgi:ABC-2 type transport system permease protein